MSKMYHDEEAAGGELILPPDQAFSLGQLVLATRLPTRMVYKDHGDGRVYDLLQFEGTWFIHSNSIVIHNHAHFSPYVKKGPGVMVLNQSIDIAVPMTRDELTTMYRFYLPNQ